MRRTRRTRPTTRAQLINRAYQKGTFGRQNYTELEMYSINDGQLYNQRLHPIQKNLMRKYQKGIYDKEKAIKLYKYAADDASKKYKKEFGVDFTPSERLAAATAMERRYRQDITSGSL